MNATELSELRKALAEQFQAAAEHLDAADALTQGGVDLLATELAAERAIRSFGCMWCGHVTECLSDAREHSATCAKHPAVIASASYVTANAELGTATVDALVKAKAGERLADVVSEYVGLKPRDLRKALNEYHLAICSPHAATT